MVLGLTEAFVTPGEPRPPHWNPIWDNGPYHGHPGSCLAHRTVLDRVGWFDESLQLGSDIQWMARAKRAGVRMGQIGQLCLRYRIHAGNITSDVHANRRNMLTALRTARRGDRRRAPMTDRISVGVAIPVYNGERYLAMRCAVSLPSPTASAMWSWSTTDPRTAAPRWLPPSARPSAWCDSPHAGIGAARSHAVSLLRTDVLVLIDADDLLTDAGIASRMQVLEDRPEVDVVFGHVRSFTNFVDGRPVPLDEPRPAHLVGALMVRRRAFERVGPFTAGLRVAEGLDWLLRARELGLVEVTVADQVLWRRVHQTNNSLARRRSIGEFPRVLKDSLDRRRASQS